jgi:fructuronate reductase
MARTAPARRFAAQASRPAAPVRLLHLGLGNFFRAHQAWYTEHASDAADWGYAAFTGRHGDLAVALTAQDCRYTLLTRAPDGDRMELVASLSEALPAAEHEAWLAHFASPALAAVTITVTEAGYCRDRLGGLDLDRPEVAADIEALRSHLRAPVRTVPARLVAGLAARRHADAGPVALVPCDNLAGNGAIARAVVAELAALVDEQLTDWLTESVTVVTTMVDRITPRATEADVEAVARATGFADRCPVVTEPFTDWVLSGRFPSARPRWEDAGATFADDIAPFEERKLWLLNGGHSLLAYAGSIRRHETVAQAVADPACLRWLEQWWAVASAQLGQRADELASYRAALLDRFANPRIGHRLEQIAADGSQKIGVRVVPVLRAQRQAGRLPQGATRPVAAWICHLRGLGALVNDARADEVVPLARGRLPEAARRVLAWLDPELGADADLGAAVTDQCEQLGAAAGSAPR